MPTDSRTSYCICECCALNCTVACADLDVGSRGRGVTTKAEEKVCREVLHFDVWVDVSLGRN